MNANISFNRGFIVLTRHGPAQAHTVIPTASIQAIEIVAATDRTWNLMIYVPYGSVNVSGITDCDALLEKFAELFADRDGRDDA